MTAATSCAERLYNTGIAAWIVLAVLDALLPKLRELFQHF